MLCTFLTSCERRRAVALDTVHIRFLWRTRSGISSSRDTVQGQVLLFFIHIILNRASHKWGQIPSLLSHLASIALLWHNLHSSYYYNYKISTLFLELVRGQWTSTSLTSSNFCFLKIHKIESAFFFPWTCRLLMFHSSKINYCREKLYPVDLLQTIALCNYTLEIKVI